MVAACAADEIACWVFVVGLKASNSPHLTYAALPHQVNVSKVESVPLNPDFRTVTGLASVLTHMYQ